MPSSIGQATCLTALDQIVVALQNDAIRNARVTPILKRKGEMEIQSTRADVLFFLALFERSSHETSSYGFTLSDK